MEGTIVRTTGKEITTYRRRTPAQRRARARRQRVMALACLWYSLVSYVQTLPQKLYRATLDIIARTIILTVFIALMMAAFGMLYGAVWFWCNAPWMLP